jgi:hypothetical protein
MLPTAFVLAALLTAADDKPAADPAATKLLADARAARATWDGFPGFTADCEVNLDGRVTRGRVTVAADGQVRLEGLDDQEAAEFAKRTLGSVIGHRLPGGPSATPCRFGADDARHPLGREVLVLIDEFHSSYRIRDQQILVVNRRMKDQRFTITVLENRKSAEGKYLPASFVVNYWNLATGELLRSEASFQSWVRVDRFDLPVTVRVVTAGKSADGPGQVTKSLTLSHHRLSQPGGAK